MSLDTIRFIVGFIVTGNSFIALGLGYLESV
jgi:hypothetical protein